MVTDAQVEAAAKVLDPGSGVWTWEEHLARARAAIEAAEAAAWQLIESAPKDGNSIYAIDNVNGGEQIVFWDDEAQNPPYQWQTADGIAYHAELFTHWRHLPDPPVKP